MMAEKKKMSLTSKVLIGMALGIIVGLFMVACPVWFIDESD